MLAWHDITSSTTQGHICFDTALSSCATASDGQVLAVGGTAGLALFEIADLLQVHMLASG